jgi:AGCS family alanine or glycine:cation symporter
MEGINHFFTWLNGYLWGPPLLVLLFGTHLFMTVRTGLIQKKIGLAIRLSVKRDKGGAGDVSQFGALTTALAATLGTGNIVGVGTAIALGGPGAVLWIWMTGLFGIATKYAEALVAVKYRVRTSDGTMLGGTMYALERGLNMKWLGVLFALFATISSFGIGCTVQANAVSKLAHENFGVPDWFSGLVMAAAIAVVILGGVKSISMVCKMLVPFAAGAYIAGCLIIMLINREFLGDSLILIFHEAFSPRAAGGGFVGAGVMAAARYGVARGLFANEAGLGSASIVAAAAQTRNPVRQALVSASGTFWDTVGVCAVTGLALVSTILANPEVVSGGGITDGAALTSLAFSRIPLVGPETLTFAIIVFAFGSSIGWSYYGERGAEYLFGKAAIPPYRAAYVMAAFLGAVMSLSTVWNIADTLNMLMAIPNLACILLLSGVVAKETKYYLTGDNIERIDQTPVPLN